VEQPTGPSVTSVVTEEVLFSGVGSLIPASTVAVLVISPGSCGALTVRVMRRLVLAAREPLHSMVPPPTEQSHGPRATLVTTTPAGRTSVMVTSGRFVEPVLRTSME
jgi:hypothetical protein